MAKHGGAGGAARFVPADELSPAEEHEWVVQLWKRMDRDLSGTIVRRELDCQELHSVIHSVLAPKGHLGMGGASYARAQINIQQCVDYCLRKADVNSDHELSFQEFKSFILTLRKIGPSGAHLVFSLFDLNQDGCIDRNEFREIFRYFLGHKPTEEEFRREWANCVSNSIEDAAGIDDFVKWMGHSEHPIFKQVVKGMAADLPLEGSSASGGRKARTNHLEGELFRRQVRWNQRFASTVNPGHMNDSLPQGERLYFSRPHSLPELQRMYTKYAGFEGQLQRLEAPEKKKKVHCELCPQILSGEGGTPLTLPGRHSRKGSMRNPATGQKVPWEDQWQMPTRFLNTNNFANRPLAPGALFSATRTASVRHVVPSKNKLVPREPRAARETTLEVIP
mmetsp:Transcript_43664/g.100756  ORF Transcript_43664/g.100756 Transcript_43664/m.100756 type:complete len:393 (-) Transcript_43664:77-1255(-)